MNRMQHVRFIESLATLKLPKLRAGAHPHPRDGVCLMEFVAFIERLPHSDNPPCTHPALAQYARSVNDMAKDRQFLMRFAPRLVGTTHLDAADLAEKFKRHAALAADAAARAAAARTAQDVARAAARGALDDARAAHAAAAAAHAAHADAAAHAAHAAGAAAHAAARAARADAARNTNAFERLVTACLDDVLPPGEHNWTAVPVDLLEELV